MNSATDRIEADVQASRHQLNDTLNALGTKLSPGQIIDEVVGLAQGQAGTFASKLGKQVMGNPLPTAMIAAGLAWLMMGNKSQDTNSSGTSFSESHESRHRALTKAHQSIVRGDSETDDEHHNRLHGAYVKALDISHNAGESVDDFKRRVAETVDRVKSSTSNMADRVGETLRDRKEDISHTAIEVTANARHLFQENPVIGGAISFALGALIGGATPLSNIEQRNLSGIATKAVDAGSDLVGRGATVAQQAIETMNSDMDHSPSGEA